MANNNIRSKKIATNMIEGSLIDKIALFALPLAISSILQQLFNAADLAVVGRFACPQAMAAVGSNSSVINLIISFFVGLTVGANAVIAMQIGQGKKEQINETVHTVIAVSLVAGFSLILIGFFISKPILVLMAAPSDVLDLAILYLRIYFFAMPALMIYNYGSAVLRSKGDSKRPLYAMILSGIINILLNLLFVIVFRLHVVGVALATVISNMFAAGLILFYLMTEEENFRLDIRKLCIKKQYLIKMMQIGLPAGLQGAVFSLSNVVIQSSVNSFGADAIAGATASANFDFVSYCAMNGFAQAAVTFTSQNFGAKKYDRCRKVFRICMACGIGASAIVVALLTTFRYSVIQLFTTDPAVTEFAMIRVMSEFIFHYLIGTYEISGGCLRGMNKSLSPALISIFGTCVFRLIYVFTYIPTHHTFSALFHVYPLSWTITGLITITVYLIERNKLTK